MYVRIVRPQIKADKLEEAAQRWQAFLAPRAQANPQFDRGFLAAAPSGEVVGVTLWHERPDDATLAQTREEMMAHMQEVAAGPPTSDEFYEVLAEI